MIEALNHRSVLPLSRNDLGSTPTINNDLQMSNSNIKPSLSVNTFPFVNESRQSNGGSSGAGLNSDRWKGTGVLHVSSQGRMRHDRLGPTQVNNKLVQENTGSQQIHGQPIQTDIDVGSIPLIPTNKNIFFQNPRSLNTQINPFVQPGDQVAQQQMGFPVLKRPIKRHEDNRIRQGSSGKRHVASPRLDLSILSNQQPKNVILPNDTLDMIPSMPGLFRHAGHVKFPEPRQQIQPERPIQNIQPERPMQQIQPERPVQPQFLNQVLPGSSAVLQPLIPLLDDNNPAELLRPSHILSQDIASRDGLIPHAQQPQNVPQRRTDMDFFVGRKGKSLKMKTIIFMF